MSKGRRRRRTDPKRCTEDQLEERWKIAFGQQSDDMSPVTQEESLPKWTPFKTKPVKIHGGKFFLAPKIVSMMPRHTHYVEPFCGGCSVLLAKEPVSDVINDADGRITTFFQVLQDEEDTKMMVHYLRFLEFGERAFNEAKQDLEDYFTGNRPGQAKRWYVAACFFVVNRMSRQGLGRDFATLSRNRLRGGLNEQLSAYLGAVEGLPEFTARLRQVVVLNQEARDVIQRQDGPNTLFYCDPPYVKASRSAKDCYGDFEMTKGQHSCLLNQLVKCRGCVILSGYRSELYDGFFAGHRWYRVEIPLPNHSSSAETKDVKTECLWLNYDPRRVVRDFGFDVVPTRA